MYNGTAEVGSPQSTYALTQPSTSLTGRARQITYTESTKYNFDYTGGAQTFTVPTTGRYKIELWGSQGASDPTYKSANGGKGGYTSGIINLNKGTNLYIYVGGTNGYNGGGSAGTAYSTQYGGNGGGATDVRLTNSTDFNGLKSRIAVAGAGGGASGPRGAKESSGSYFYSALTGGNAGQSGLNNDAFDGYTDSAHVIHYGGNGLNGSGSGGSSKDMDITSVPDHGTGGAGQNGRFGAGGRGGDSGALTTTDSSLKDDYSGGSGGGGGSGYFGGGGGAGGGGWWGATGASGGGGSSYISGNFSYNAISSSATENNITLQNNSNHYSGYVFTDSIIKKGNESFSDPSGTVVTGHSGNGYARITYYTPD